MVQARLHQTVMAALAFQPHIVIAVDSKGFSFRVLKQLKGNKKIKLRRNSTKFRILSFFWCMHIEFAGADDRCLLAFRKLYQASAEITFERSLCCSISVGMEGRGKKVKKVDRCCWPHALYPSFWGDNLQSQWAIGNVCGTPCSWRCLFWSFGKPLISFSYPVMKTIYNIHKVALLIRQQWYYILSLSKVVILKVVYMRTLMIWVDML